MRHRTIGHGRRGLRCAMPDMLEAGVVLQTSVLLLLLLLHHLLVVIRCPSCVASLVFSALVILVVVAALVGEILRSLVFVRGAILCRYQCPSGRMRDAMRNLRIETWRLSR